MLAIGVRRTACLHAYGGDDAECGFDTIDLNLVPLYNGAPTDERRWRGHISFENRRWVQRDGLNEFWAVHEG